VNVDGVSNNADRVIEVHGRRGIYCEGVEIAVVDHTGSRVEGSLRRQEARGVSKRHRLFVGLAEKIGNWGPEVKKSSVVSALDEEFGSGFVRTKKRSVQIRSEPRSLWEIEGFVGFDDGNERATSATSSRELIDIALKYDAIAWKKGGVVRQFLERARVVPTNAESRLNQLNDAGHCT